MHCQVVMRIDPGFAGQKFLPEMLPKIRSLRQLCQARGLDPFIEVDGEQTPESAGQAIEAGANAIAAGSAIFGSVAFLVAGSDKRDIFDRLRRGDDTVAAELEISRSDLIKARLRKAAIEDASASK